MNSLPMLSQRRGKSTSLTTFLKEIDSSTVWRWFLTSAAITAWPLGPKLLEISVVHIPEKAQLTIHSQAERPGTVPRTWKMQKPDNQFFQETSARPEIFEDYCICLGNFEASQRTGHSRVPK
jgi:hypothetical protein